MICCERGDFENIKEYASRRKNQNGSINWFLFRWDDGKDGVRRLVRCRNCGALYLVQAYHLNKFSEQKDTLFEDYFVVKDEQEADYVNRKYTGVQLEHRMRPKFQTYKTEELK